MFFFFLLFGGNKTGGRGRIGRGGKVGEWDGLNRGVLEGGARTAQEGRTGKRTAPATGGVGRGG